MINEMIYAKSEGDGLFPIEDIVLLLLLSLSLFIFDINLSFLYNMKNSNETSFSPSIIVLPPFE
jgi:hypothetical protein